MLIVPPRSQTLKLQLSYQNWEYLRTCALVTLGSTTTVKQQAAAREHVKLIDQILEQLLKEGHV